MASGDTLVTFTAESFRIPQSQCGFYDVRNDHPVISLSTGGDSAHVGFILPRNYSGNGITVYHHWTMATATTNKARLQTSFERVGCGTLDTDTNNWATGSVSGDINVPSPAGALTISCSTHTNGAGIASIAVGEYCRCCVSRVATSGTDASGELHLFGIELKET